MNNEDTRPGSTRTLLSMLRGRAGRRSERGAVTVVVATLLGFGILTGSAALVVDVGAMYVEREELQSGADAAAMAVAERCLVATCSNGSAMVVAAKYANKNAKDGHTKVTEICGKWGGVQVTCPPPSTALGDCIGSRPADNYVEVRVITEESNGSSLLPPVFSRTLAGNSDFKGTTVAACSRATKQNFCSREEDLKFQHTFNKDAGTATITTNRPLCNGETMPVTLVSYTSPDNEYALPQFMYDYESGMLSPTTPSLSFTVDLPPCYYQIDFVFRDRPINPLLAGGPSYGSLKVGEQWGAPGNRSTGVPQKAWGHGGTRACYPQPAPTYSYKCDHTQIDLRNGSTANVDAAFTITTAAGSALHRVAPGGLKTVKVMTTDARTIKIESSKRVGEGFQAIDTNWVKPAGC